MPQGKELINIVEQHPDLSYAKIWKLYGWGGQPTSVKGALNRAGYRRNTARLRTGGGPLDVDVMSHEEFWGRVDETMAKREAEVKATKTI